MRKCAATTLLLIFVTTTIPCYYYYYYYYYFKCKLFSSLTLILSTSCVVPALRYLAAALAALLLVSSLNL
jgi:hypothetical protein